MIPNSVAPRSLDSAHSKGLTSPEPEPLQPVFIFASELYVRNCRKFMQSIIDRFFIDIPVIFSFLFISVFGLATLVFNGLEMAMHTMMQGAECLSDIIFVHPVLHGLFTFLQMHFLFVNSQVSAI